MIKSFFFIFSILTSLLLGETAMTYTTVKQPKKLIIGMEIRTSNDKCLVDMPRIWDKFFKEKIHEKIPHKVNNIVYALYTDYEGDYTKHYSYIVGCEVSALEDVPAGLVGKSVPSSTYAVFTTQGTYPQGLAQAWQTIWKAPLKRAYTSDLEVYNPDFNPQTKPEVKVYIAL
jgi:predicted transcriptional regulator YdeE